MYAHCNEYIQHLNLPPLEHFIACKLLEELQPTGWMTTPLKEIARDVNVEIAAVESILKRLQMIEPAGLFCRNLVECLTLQAKDQDLLDNTLDKILKNLHLLGKGSFDLLKRRCACSDTDLANNLKIIKSFDPKPGLKFSSEPIVIREPDLKITKTETGWLVSLNKSTLPSVKINKDIAKNISKTQIDTEQKNFVKEKMAEASWLKNALQKRNETMLRVATEIAKRQTEFLEKGQGFITPMVLREVADAVNMHESTISRVTTGSLMETPQGTLELKSFFSTGVQSHDDLTSQSSASIKFKIRKMIQCEDNRSPISDDEIVEELKKHNIGVARRTVAKYRKVQNIPASFMRKRQNKLRGLL
jgi:RNA polymerase sigma-54 factor